MRVFLFLLATSCFSFAKVEDLTLEEKVGQLFMVHFRGERANEDAKVAIQELHVGSIIYYNWANGLHSPKQVQELSAGLQALAKIPLLIAADQEGGLVARLNEGFTQFPGNMALGMTNMPALAEESAYVIGKELLSVGVNMNLAPVVDVNSNPRNPVIGVRSFGEDPKAVIAFAEKAQEGYLRAGVISCLKHFPGHGDTNIDSHEDLPVLSKTIEQLKKVELLPFAELSAKADTIMTAHLLIPALDPDHCSTLSKKTLEYLRHQIGFQGVILSDSLVMGGVLKRCQGSVEEAAIQAFNAGCDLLILGGSQLVGANELLELTMADVRKICKKFIESVKSGRISEEAINASVERILKLKQSRLSAVQKTELQDYHVLALKIASSALKTEKSDVSRLTLLKEKKIGVIAPLLLKNSVTPLLCLGKEGTCFFFSTLNPTAEEIQKIKEETKAMDVLAICSYNAWKNPSQAELIQSLCSGEKPTILLVMRDPLDSGLFPNATALFTTFSPTSISVEAVCEALHGHEKSAAL